MLAPELLHWHFSPSLSMLKLHPVFFHKIHFLFVWDQSISPRYLCYVICEKRFKCLKVFKKIYLRYI